MSDRYFPLDPLREEEIVALLNEEEKPERVEPQATRTTSASSAPADKAKVWSYDELYDAIRADSKYLVEAWQKFPGGKGVDTRKLLEAVNAGKYPAPMEKK